MKILVRATNWIGDAVMSLPAIRAIGDRFPEAEITVLAKPWVGALYEGERVISAVVSLDNRALLDKAVWTLRRQKFDLAVVLPNSFRSALDARLAGAKRVIGYARDGRGLLLSEAVPVPAKGDTPPHESYYYLELLRRVGWIQGLPEVTQILLDQRDQKRGRGEELLAGYGVKRAVGVSPGAAFGGAKRWLPERFAEAARRLAAELDASVMVFGSGAEKAMCEEVAQKAGGRNLAGQTTLRQFIDMTAACSLFLTNDSGAMHIASALAIPSVTVFGPTNEFATGPLGDRARIVRQPVECAPCMLRECPIDHRCMTGVTAEQVIAAAEGVSKRC